jgi:hypothetical protein
MKRNHRDLEILQKPTNLAIRAKNRVPSTLKTKNANHSTAIFGTGGRDANDDSSQSTPIQQVFNPAANAVQRTMPRRHQVAHLLLPWPDQYSKLSLA